MIAQKGHVSGSTRKQECETMAPPGTSQYHEGVWCDREDRRPARAEKMHPVEYTSDSRERPLCDDKTIFAACAQFTFRNSASQSALSKIPRRT